MCRPPAAALTGMLSRMKSLPVVSHDVDGAKRTENNERFGPESGVRSRGIEKYLLERITRGPKATLRCVYNYEDRYKFSRILLESDLVFDAHFESGNLLKARRVSFGDVRDKNSCFQEYDLELHTDVTSAGHTQWFYFCCSNTVAGREVKFNLTNYHKSDSLFNYGMRVIFLISKSTSTLSSKTLAGIEHFGEECYAVLWLATGAIFSLSQRGQVH